MMVLGCGLICSFFLSLANSLNSLALAEMKTLLRAVYSSFTTLPDPEMTAGDMEMSDQLISSRPRGQRCLLQFVPICSASDSV